MKQTLPVAVGGALQGTCETGSSSVSEVILVQQLHTLFTLLQVPFVVHFRLVTWRTKNERTK